MDSPSNKALTAEEEELLKDSLKRCSTETVNAALTFRKTGEPELIPTIIHGIIERFLEPDIRPRLKTGGDDLRVLEDLGIDSLTMVEVIMLVEETIHITIDNDELRDLRTIGDINVFIDCKIKGIPVPAKPIHISVEGIDQTMPHGQPFLFIQEAALSPSESRGTYIISGDEFFLEGHFKENPVFPASIMLEALGQLGVLHLLKIDNPDLQGTVDKTKILFKSCDGVRCNRVCKPGDKLMLSVKPKRIKHPLATFEGHVSVGSERVAFAEEISLMFDLKQEEPPPPEDPSPAQE